MNVTRSESVILICRPNRCVVPLLDPASHRPGADLQKLGGLDNRVERGKRRGGGCGGRHWFRSSSRLATNSVAAWRARRQTSFTRAASCEEEIASTAADLLATAASAFPRCLSMICPRSSRTSTADDGRDLGRRMEFIMFRSALDFTFCI